MMEAAGYIYRLFNEVMIMMGVGGQRAARVSGGWKAYTRKVDELFQHPGRLCQLAGNI